MTEQTEHKIDRSSWTSGPWDNEPDKINWTDPATGMACMIVRNYYGQLCGYVACPEGHPAYGKSYNEVDADVHGGLTYAAACQGHICHVPEPGSPDNVWWLGFDCGHFSDAGPRSDPLFGGTYRDVAYVTAECTKLAAQLNVPV